VLLDQDRGRAPREAGQHLRGLMAHRTAMKVRSRTVTGVEE
jgi:hypothetical protein